MKSKLLIATITTFLLAIICACMQSIFYGELDDQGYVNDSAFIPLSFLFFMISIVLGIIWVARYAYRRFTA